MKDKNGKEKLKKAQKKKLGAIFFRVVVITSIISVALIGVIAAAYKLFIYQGEDRGGESKTKGVIQKEKDINQTIAIFGVDKDGYRTDVIFVVNYNSKTNKAKIVSVPRDTMVEWSEEQQQKLNEYKGSSVSVSKINEMTSYGGIENIRDFTIDEIENILDIKIDHYAIVTIDAFRKTVDAIGGVEVDVPVLEGDGLHYDDYAQDLHIHLNPGIQQLDGEQAEGLVRFRKGYAEGDVGRIRTQQLFLEAFAKKLMNPAILTKLPQIVPVIFTTIKTDMPLTEIPQYYAYIKKFDLAQLNFKIIPGEADYQNHKWYFIPNMAEMTQFTEEVFHDKLPETENTAVVVEDKEVTIEVLNATPIKGAAGGVKDELEKVGYNVERIDNYDTNDLPSTKIYAKDLTKAGQFKKYFAQAALEQNSNITYDIQIVLGNDMQ
jgi:LCP family protein required for cell wall assembly